MAYGLKYQSELFTRNGHTFRLLIHEDGFVGSGVTVIGNLRALTVEIQGGSEGIDSPVIKTSLSWSVADEQDKGLVDGVRYGHWEDLYTADSTHFKVVLQRDGCNWWTGYLTPDSWHDNLQYNSYISFTARDNIGHLQDFEYDGPSGLVSVKGIVEAALAKIGFGMGLTVFDKTKWMKAGTNNGYEGFLVDSNIFAGKNWYQALESVLAGFGLVMRFIGSNAFGICPIRYLPDLMGTAKTAQFVNRSGVRELSPAYKQIVESGSYELSPYDTPTFSEGDFLVNRPLDIYTLNKDGWTANRINALRPYDMAIESTLGYMLTPVSGEKDRYALFRAWSTAGGAVTHTVRAGNNSAISLSYSFRGLFQRNAGAWLNNPLLAPRKTGINVYVTWTDTDGGVQYLNKDGQWQDEQTVAAEYKSQNVEDSQAQRRAWNTDGNISLTTPDSTGSLSLRFEGTADIKGTEYDGLYILLGGISAAVESAAVPNGWKVTTIYDDTQNTTLKRDIDFGVVPTWLKGPGTISNGIYLASAVSGVSAAYNATWGAESLSLPIPVLNALQILAMHAKANSVFTGELMAADGSELTFSERWTAYGKNCLLVGGTLDLMTGRITDAKLVEYDTYGSVWGGISDIDYSVITGGDGNYGNASPSGTTGGGGSSVPVGAGIRALSLSMPEQFSVEGSPVSGQSGELTVTLAAGYAIPTAEQVAAIAILASMLEVKNYASGKWALHVKPAALDASGTMRTIDGIYSDGFVSAGGVGSGGGGGGQGGINTITIGSKSYSAQSGSTAIIIPTAGTDSVKVPLGITALENTAASLNTRVTALENAPQGGVTRFGGVTGAIIVRGGQTANGSVNLTMSGTQLQAAIVGLGSLAFKSSLVASDIPSLAISKISGLQTALDAKQSTISDLATIRSNAANGQTAYGWGNHAGLYLPLTGGAITGTVHMDGNSTDAPLVRNYTSTVSGNWSRYLATIQVDGTSKFHIGAYGSYVVGASDSGINYAYAGFYGYNGDNLRFYQDRLTFGSNLIYHSGNLTKATLGLGNVDNTADANKSVAYASNAGQLGGIAAANYYHSGNANKSDVAWSCSTLAMGDTLTMSGDEVLAAFSSNLYFNRGLQTRTVDFFGTSIRFRNTGNVGIGTTSPSQKLHVVGNIIATGAITAGAASDARLKDNIRNLANAVTVLKSLRPVSFDWNATATSNFSELKGHDVGLVAQEVEPLIPSAIGNIFGDYKRLDYTKVTPYLIAGWQDHESRIEVLERENAELKRRLNIN